MGLFDKVKNLFTEEVEEPIIKKEEPKKQESKKEIKKQERKIEIAPARRESTILLEEEMEEVVKEEKPVLPIYFSDEDFEDLEKPKQKEEKKIEIKEAYKGRIDEVKKEEKKYFKPSPIISPVYGILDKNYKKDDITTKENTITHRSEKVTVDDIRNKAYGTLEDELENNLLNDQIIETKKEDTGIDIFEELETRESRNSKMDLLRNDFEIEKEEIEKEEIEETDLSLELEKQKQKIEEINEIIKNNISPDKKAVTSRKIDNILEELDEIEELIPEKEENKKIETEELIEESQKNMNNEEEIENNNDEIEESDLFNLIDSMYEKRDE